VSLLERLATQIVLARADLIRFEKPKRQTPALRRLAEETRAEIKRLERLEVAAREGRIRERPVEIVCDARGRV